jgi:Cdc6-like AAA superfamily ATPase
VPRPGRGRALAERLAAVHADAVGHEVRHRDGEVNQPTNALDPIVDGERLEAAFLFGPSGAGKTCIAQYTVDRLRDAVVDLRTPLRQLLGALHPFPGAVSHP